MTEIQEGCPLRSRLTCVLFFTACGLEGVACLAALGSIPPDPSHAVWGGFSAARLILLALTALATAGFVTLAVLCLKSQKFDRPAAVFLMWRQTGHRRTAAVLLPLAIGTMAGFLINGFLAGRYPAWQAAAFRMAPLVVWGCLICFQFSLVLLLVFLQETPLQLSRRQKMRIAVAVAAALLLAVAWVILAKTGLGFTVSAGDWVQAPNPPVVFSQVVLATSILILLFWAAPSLLRWKHFDLLLSAAIWLAAVILWEVTPYNTSFFITRPLPPNYETYPYSDAHDFIITGQTLLIGEGYGGRTLILRPLHVLLLTIYHVIAGQNYDRVVALQVLVLALIPMFIFWVGRKVHTRLGGVAAALLVILRERNSLVISGMIPGGNTHVKLFMTELPTILGMVILIFLLLRWFEKPQSHPLIPLAAGGVIGALTLIRSQTIILLPVLVVLLVLWKLRRPRVWLHAAGWMVAGTFLFLFPWLARSYHLTGYFELEKAPSYSHYYETLLITGQDVPQQPGESGNQYNARLTGIILDYVVRHPAAVLRYTCAHFLHNELTSTLVLPVEPDFSGVVEYVKDNILWEGGNYRPQAPLEAAFMLSNIAIAGIGIGAACARKKGLVLIPAAVRFGYNLSLGLGRRSGGRYFMPVDWVALLFYGLGLAEMIFWVAALLHEENGDLPLGEDSVEAEVGEGRGRPRPYLFAAAAVLAAGMVLPAAEWLVPPRYQPLDAAQIVSMLQSRPASPQSVTRFDQLEKMTDQPGVWASWGRGLYPRYFQAGEGLRSSEAFLETRRLRFDIIGPQPGEVILPGTVQPEYFPNASDVAVIGCAASGAIDAVVVVALDPSGDHYYWREPLPEDWKCPLR